MSTRAKQVKAMQALAEGSMCSAHAAYDARVRDVVAELGEALRGERLQPIQRRRLLRVVHACRAVDSALRAFAVHHGADPKKLTGMGKSLSFICSGKNFSKPLYREPRFDTRVLNPRNKYMHAANRYPTSAPEVDNLISEMYGLLQRLYATVEK